MKKSEIFWMHCSFCGGEHLVSPGHKNPIECNRYLFFVVEAGGEELKITEITTLAKSAFLLEEITTPKIKVA